MAVNAMIHAMKTVCLDVAWIPLCAKDVYLVTMVITVIHHAVYPVQSAVRLGVVHVIMVSMGNSVKNPVGLDVKMVNVIKFQEDVCVLMDSTMLHVTSGVQTIVKEDA